MSGVGFKIDTDVNIVTGNIRQTTQPYGPEGYDFGLAVRDITIRIIKTQEEQVRQALILLGWTPPK